MVTASEGVACQLEKNVGFKLRSAVSTLADLEDSVARKFVVAEPIFLSFAKVRRLQRIPTPELFPRG